VTHALRNLRSGIYYGSAGSAHNPIATRSSQRVCTRQAWAVVDTYCDDGKSGETIEGRPAFQKLLQNAMECHFDLILVIDIDRITRSTRAAESGFIFDTLRQHRVKIATPNQIIDLENDEQGLFVGIAREFAKYEKLKILLRTKRGKLARLRRVCWLTARSPSAIDVKLIQQILGVLRRG